MPASAEKTYYKADGEPFSRWDNGDGTFRDGIPWKPSIHMPRWASRITLEVTGVKVERLQDISEEEAKAEGCDRHQSAEGNEVIEWTWVQSFARLWDSINGEREGASWAGNPWVAAISFKVVKP